MEFLKKTAESLENLGYIDGGYDRGKNSFFYKATIEPTWLGRLFKKRGHKIALIRPSWSTTAAWEGGKDRFSFPEFDEDAQQAETLFKKVHAELERGETYHSVPTGHIDDIGEEAYDSM